MIIMMPPKTNYKRVNTELVRVSLQPGQITPWMERVQQHIPAAELDVISGVGHFPMLEVPAIVNEKNSGLYWQINLSQVNGAGRSYWVGW